MISTLRFLGACLRNHIDACKVDDELHASAKKVAGILLFIKSDSCGELDKGDLLLKNLDIHHKLCQKYKAKKGNDEPEIDPIFSLGGGGK